jgi:Glycosyl hydrolases family 39
MNATNMLRAVLVGALLGLCAVAGGFPGAQSASSVVIDWTKTQPNRTTPTLQVVVNPKLRRGSPIHDAAFTSLHRLGADYVRYAFWYPYPKLAVAELKAPTANQTSWDFQYLDPLVEDFFHATEGHTSVLSFCTQPQWMFATARPVAYPDDPDQAIWDYPQGTDLHDAKALGDYYGRLASWYISGGFNDELGKFHSSGHHYNIGYWEVFNEIEWEHSTTPEQYVERYDAIVEAVRKVAPQMKFVGLSLGMPSQSVKLLEYFLDPKHHKPGIPLDYISFHFYAVPTADQSMDHWQYTFFDQANQFLTATRYILATRDRLSPTTKVMVNEAGSILTADLGQSVARPDEKPIPPAYWNLSGALYAYLYVELAKMGVDVLGESQLVGFPTQFPSVTMVDWKTGQPNARFTVLELLKNNLGPGDDLVDTEVKNGGMPGDGEGVHAQGFLRGGRRKLLLLNKRDREITIELPNNFVDTTMQTISRASPELSVSAIVNTRMRLSPLSVSIISLKN